MSTLLSTQSWLWGSRSGGVCLCVCVCVCQDTETETEQTRQLRLCFLASFVSFSPHSSLELFLLLSLPPCGGEPVLTVVMMKQGQFVWCLWCFWSVSNYSQVKGWTKTVLSLALTVALKLAFHNPSHVYSQGMLGQD